MVVGGMEEDGCVWWDVEDSWELKEINKKLYSNELKKDTSFKKTGVEERVILK
jgi:hypothetical protein